ncbi:MAG: bifunctional riboflavin kinase/FAD synthetase [Geminicoccaceae bacterium]
MSAISVHRDLDRLPPSARAIAVAIGNFDGVHLGHGCVLEEARRRARDLGTEVGVLSFHPHPRTLVGPAKAPRRLTRTRDKIRLLAKQEVRHLYLLRFNDKLRQTTAEGFVERVLRDQLALRHVIVGEDFRFGHKRAGDVALLRALGPSHGFGVSALPPRTVQGQVCSSTRIRELLGEGDVETAEQFLGRSYQFDGLVVPGDRLGRELGYPTANLRPLGGPIQMPAPGIYAVRARPPSGSWLDGAASYGWRPTVGGADLRFEVYLFDFDGDLYGQTLRVALIKHLRPEKTFDGIEALKAQMARDCEQARETLGAREPERG